MNRFCAIILTVITTVLLLGTGVYAKQSNVQNDEVKLLKALDIISDSENDTKLVSRAEFLKLGFKLVKLYDAACGYSGGMPFKDVAADSADASFISFAFDSGYIIGDNGYFYPDRTITLAEANAILVRLTGYSFIAEQKGVQFAISAMGMNKGTALRSTEVLKFGDAYRLIYNILEAPYYKQVSAGQKITFADDSSLTIMGHFHNVYKKEGILKAAGTVSMSDSRYNSEYAIINQNRYLCLADDAEDLVGFRVKYYYRSNGSDDDELIALTPYKNDVLSIEAGKLLIDDPGYTVKNIVYFLDNGKKNNAEISEYADMIYNKEAYPDFDKNTISLKEGTINLIDNNSDGVYDVIVVDTYVNVVVKGINGDDRFVIGMDNSRINLDNSAGQSVVIYGDDGSYYELGDISYGDVITVFQSKSGRKTIVYDTVSKIFDSIEAVSNDGDRITVTAGGREYEVDRNYSTSAEYILDPITLKTNTGLYLDVFGKIAGVGDDKENFSNYGYIFNAAKSLGISGDYQLKIFTDKGIFEVFTLKNKIQCQQVTMSDREAYDEIVRRGIYNVVQYETNMENKISSITFPVDNTSVGKPMKGTFSLDVTISGGQDGEYRTGIFGGKYLISGKTLVFGIPDMSKPANRDEKNFKLMSMNSFSENVYYTVDIYNLDEVYCAGVIISKPIESKVSFERMSDEVVVIDKVSKGIDSEENEYDIISGWHRGSYVKWRLSNDETDTVLDDIAQGDILKVYRDSDGIVTYTTRIERLGKNPVFSERAYDGDYFGARGYMEYGKVGAIKGGSLVLTTDDGATVRPHTVTSAYVYLFDKSTGKVTQSNINNIYSESDEGKFDGDCIFVNLKWNRVKDIVIVR